jgi:hypothetical protein
MFDETLDNYQHSTRPIPETLNYILVSSVSFLHLLLSMKKKDRDIGRSVAISRPLGVENRYRQQAYVVGNMNMKVGTQTLWMKCCSPNKSRSVPT